EGGRGQAPAAHRDRRRGRPPGRAGRLAGGRVLPPGIKKRNWPADSASPERAGGGREPRAAIGVEKRRERLEDAGVIAVEPEGFVRREHAGHDQPPGDRCERKRLERRKRGLS